MSDLVESLEDRFSYDATEIDFSEVWARVAGRK